ncbi:MAG: CYTH domain-containing protein, partial [bacterium]|nr:CYTH domain-containing protein [bacterium]
MSNSKPQFIISNKEIISIKIIIFLDENYYFDTDDFFIRNNKLGLRIRHKNTTWKVTMKKPCEDYLC